MPEPPDRPPEDTPDIADASWLAGESQPSAPEVRPAPPADESGAYIVEGVTESAEVPAPTPPPRAPAPVARSRAEARRAIDPEEAVRQVWSRGAEWGADLARIGAVFLATAGLVWLLFDVANPTLGLLILLVGLASMVLLSYPLVITLERPVRVTPEQAVKDFYGALSHHVPHYRRMWLLLSAEGRTSGEYGSFEGFRGYWKRRLAKLRGERVSSWTPLVFEIQGFKSDRSAGKAAVDARYTVEVSIRGRRSEGPIATVPVATTLVRGPDNQWYLDRGTLPEA
jgi:hypothetical protein